MKTHGVLDALRFPFMLRNETENSPDAEPWLGGLIGIPSNLVEQY